jgi:soluble P-type ATPase
MISIDIPDFGPLELHHLVSDYNGTLALDGILHAGVATRLRELAQSIAIHVVTADTFGVARAQLKDLPVTLTIVPSENQAFTKLQYAEGLGVRRVVAIGNGRNDRKIFGAVALSIGLIQEEGLATTTLLEADLVTTGIADALDLLANPDRLKSTLRA